MEFDPRYDTPMTDEQCKESKRAFLRSIGVKDMNELNRIFEECNYNIDEINKRLTINKRSQQ